MATYPTPSGKQVVNALRKLGFTVVQIRGSHHMMKPIADGTLRNIIRKAGLTPEEFYRV